MARLRGATLLILIVAAVCFAIWWREYASRQAVDRRDIADKPEPAAAPARSLTPTEIRTLIRHLAISEDPASNEPVFTPSVDTPRRDIRVTAYEAADKLRECGLDAFPMLLETLDDARQSVAFRRVLPSTVGDACYCIITEQLYALPDRYRGSFFRQGQDGKSHDRPVYYRQLFQPHELKPWLDERQGRSLAELQLEALNWVLAEEEKIGATNAEDEATFIEPLRRRLVALQRQVESTRKR